MRTHGARPAASSPAPAPPGGTADAYRISAEGLDRQADRAKALLFGRAVAMFRAADENRLVADALEVFEGGPGLWCRPPLGKS